MPRQASYSATQNLKHIRNAKPDHILNRNELFSPKLKPLLIEDIKNRIHLAETDSEITTITTDLSRLSDQQVRDHLLKTLIDCLLVSNNPARAIEIFTSNIELFDNARLAGLFQLLLSNSRYSDVLKVFYVCVGRHEKSAIPVGHLDLVTRAVVGMAESGGLVGGQGFEVMKQVEVIARERAVELSDWARMSAACLAMRGGQFEDAMNYVYMNGKVFAKERTLRGNLRVRRVGGFCLIEGQMS